MPLRSKSGAEEKIEIGNPAPAWMLTYSDLMTQLLIFFVMMFALASALNELQLQALKKRMDRYVKREKLEKYVDLYIDRRGLVISLKGEIMFKEKSVSLEEKAKKILRDMSAFVLPYPNPVRIEGHTDWSKDFKISQKEAWEISTKRANNVAEFLVDEISFPPYRLSSSGYGWQKPILTDKQREKLIKIRQEMLKDLKELYISELRRLIIIGINQKLDKERKNLVIKYAKLLQKEREAKIRLELSEKKKEIEEKFDKIIKSFSKREELNNHKKDWSLILSEYKISPEIIDILGGKEVFWKANFRRRLQKLIIEMANLTTEMRSKNRRVDVIIERISAALGKKDII